MEQTQSMGYQHPQTAVQHQQHQLATIASDMQAIPEQPNTQSLQANKRQTDDNSNRCIRQGLGSDTSSGWQRDRSKRLKMDSQPIHQTHLSQRDHGNLTSNTSHVENAHTRVPTQDPNRCSSNSLGMEKGSKNKAMNDIIQSTYIKLNQKGIHVTSEHTPGCTNHRADYLSRNPDPKDYQLNPRLYQQMCKKFNYHPARDLFANKWNRQTKKYCSWRQDRNSQGNAWKLRWDKQTNWLNPQWELIPTALNKLQQEKATAMICLPMWKSAPWYSKMVNMMQAEPHIIKDKPIYKDPEGKNMPPPRWATLITILQG